MRALFIVILFVFSVVLHAEESCEKVLKVPKLNRQEAKAFAAMNKKEGIFKAVSHFTALKEGPFQTAALPFPFMLKSIAFMGQYLPGKVGFWSKLVLEYPGHAVLIMQPELVREVFKRTDELDRLYSSLGHVIGKDSFFILQDSDPEQHAKWEVAHKLIMPHFQPRRIIDEYFPKIQDIAQDLIQTWKEEGTTEITVAEVSFYFAARVASELFLNHRLTLAEARELRPITDTILSERAEREEGGKKLHQFLLEKTNLAQASDLVKDLLRHQKENQLPDEWVSAQLATLYFAAAETTQALLGTSLYYLAKHQSWAKAIRDEYSTFGADEALSLNKTPQIRDFINENLRMHAPVPALSRVSKEEFVLGGYRIPKDRLVYMSFQSLHRNQEIWGENTNTFDPDRFLDDEDDQLAKTLMPFGGGIRVCVGKYLAMFEVAIFLGEITKQLTLSVPSQQQLPLKYGPATLRVKDELKIQIAPR